MGRCRLLLCEWFSAQASDHELCGEGAAIRDALLAELRLLSGLSIAVVIPFGATVPAGAEALQAPAEGALPEFIAMMARQFDLSLIVAPESGGLLASFARVVEEARWLGCTPAAVEIASSKQETVRVLREADISTPVSIDDSTKWVVKPDDGAGGLGVQVHDSLVEAERDFSSRSARGERPTLERWVQGEARSLTLLVGGGETRLLSVNRQRITRDDHGRVAFLGVDSAVLPLTPALADLAARIHWALPGLRGLVGIDYVEHPRHGAVVIEINPRPTSAYVGLAERLGWSPLSEWLGLHLREFPI